MRSVVFRYEDVASLADALSETRGSLPLSEGEIVSDGEWVLAIFEIGSRRRATAAAARGVRAAGDAHLAFERRDWERLVGFVAARSEHMRSARPAARSSSAPSKAPTSTASSLPAASLSDAPPRSRRLDDIPPSVPIESSRVPFGARVLVVDGDAAAGGELRAMLSEMGLVVELVATTASAAERMRAETFDALVLDLYACGGDSRAFVSKLRCDARACDIPVLFLSSKPTSREVVDAFASGADDFLAKPLRAPELAARIFGLLRRARLAAAGGR